MSKFKQPKIIYPILSAVIALIATAALYLGLWGIWLAGCVAANVFLAAGIVCGTEVKTVRRKNPMAKFSEDQPNELEGRVYRVPFLSVIIAIFVALGAGFLSQSAIAGLLVLFTWGGLGLPIALCILYGMNFGLSMQTGLISSIFLTGGAGAIQVFLSTPDHSFDLKWCLETASSVLKEYMISALHQTRDLLYSQFTDLQQVPAAMREFVALSNETSIQQTAEQFVELFISSLPALFAIAILALLCVIWWFTKAALQRQTVVEIKHMGRLDGYVAGRVISLLCMLSYLIDIVAKSGSVLQIAALNVNWVISAVLAFAGFSVVLYIINSRIPSAVARVFLIIGAVMVSISSCGFSILFLVGLISTAYDLRKLLGGGTLK